MTIRRFARNVVLGALVWRVIALRRAALARERRARRIAPLLITAGGAGVFLAAGPLILGRPRHAWRGGRRGSDVQDEQLRK
jgi:hypothetical protein